MRGTVGQSVQYTWLCSLDSVRRALIIIINICDTIGDRSNAESAAEAEKVVGIRHQSWDLWEKWNGNGST